MTRPLTRFLRLAAALSLVLATALTGVVASAPKAQAQEGWLSSAAAFSGRHANEMGLGGGQVGTAWVEGWLYHTVKWPAAVRAGQPFSFKRCIVRVGIEETTGYEGSVRTVHMDGQTFGVGPFNTQDSGEWGVGELCKTFTATAPSTPGTSVPFTAWSVPYNSYVGAGYAGSCCTVWEWLEEERAGFAYANNFYTGTYTFQIPTVYTNLTAANDGSALVQQSGSTTVNVLANDAGVTGGTGTVVAAPTGMAITSQATKGTCSITGTQVTYVNNGTAGADSCRYHVNQSSTDAEGPTNGPATATVYFNVSSKPTPQPDTVQTMDTQPVTTDPRRNDTDPNTADSPTLENNLPLTIIGARIISGGGSVSFTGTGITFDPLTDYYYLAPGQRATAVIEYTVRDSRGGINTSRVTVVVNGELSPPIVVEETAQVAESATTTYDPTANDLHLEPSSIDPIITSIDTSATKGGVTFTDNAITYNPKGLFESLAQGETASDVVTYTIFDGNLSDTGEALITIVGANDAPVATDDTAATTAGAAVLVDVLANDTDIDASDTHTVTDVAVTSGTGSVSISGNKLTYDPAGTYDYLAAGESATVLVTYTMSDPFGGTSTATVKITVTGVNEGPTAVNDTGASTTEDGPAVTVPVLSNDTDPDSTDSITVTSVTQAAGGKVTTDGTTVTLDPAAGFDQLVAGQTVNAVFTYTITDSHGATSTATVTVPVSGANDAPIAVADVLAIPANSGPLSLDVLANDTDPDTGSTISLVSLTIGNMPAPYTTQPTTSGSTVTFDPAGQFGALAQGEVVEVIGTYVIRDEFGVETTGQVTVRVVGVNNDPTTGDTTGSTDEDTALVFDNLLSLASDPRARSSMRSPPVRPPRRSSPTRSRTNSTPRQRASSSSG